MDKEFELPTGTKSSKDLREKLVKVKKSFWGRTCDWVKRNKVILGSIAGTLAVVGTIATIVGIVAAKLEGGDGGENNLPKIDSNELNVVGLQLDIPGVNVWADSTRWISRTSEPGPLPIKIKNGTKETYYDITEAVIDVLREGNCTDKEFDFIKFYKKENIRKIVEGYLEEEEGVFLEEPTETVVSNNGACFDNVTRTGTLNITIPIFPISEEDYFNNPWWDAFSYDVEIENGKVVNITDTNPFSYSHSLEENRYFEKRLLKERKAKEAKKESAKVIGD